MFNNNSISLSLLLQLISKFVVTVHLKINHILALIVLFLILLDPIIDFSLEPNGNKFAIIHGVPPTRISATVYKINEKGTPPSNLSMLMSTVV